VVVEVSVELAELTCIHLAVGWQQPVVMKANNNKLGYEK
jgi:hypothetical protein